MKATDVSPNIVKLTRFGFVNAYLVREDDGFTLVDTMITGSAGQLVDAARNAGGEIVRIAPTHAHDDHIGSLVALSKRLPDAKIIVGKRDGRFIHGEKALDPDEPSGKLLGKYPRRDVEFDRELIEGDTIGSLKIYDVPGHTPGQIAMLDERDGTLIAADAYSSFGGVATTAGPYWRMPLPGFSTWNRELALESAIRLRDLKPTQLLVGHGPERKNPGPAMDKAIAARS